MLFFRAKVRACNPTRTSTTKSAFFAAGFAAECLRRCRGLPRWVTPTNHLKNGLFSPFASMGCVVSLRRGSPGAFPPYPPQSRRNGCVSLAGLLWYFQPPQRKNRLCVHFCSIGGMLLAFALAISPVRALEIA